MVSSNDAARAYLQQQNTSGTCWPGAGNGEPHSVAIRQAPLKPEMLRCRGPPPCANDQDKGTPHGAAPPTPSGIRVGYHGGSTGLSFNAQSRGGAGRESRLRSAIWPPGCPDIRQNPVGEPAATAVKELWNAPTAQLSTLVARSGETIAASYLSLSSYGECGSAREGLVPSTSGPEYLNQLT
jgi:hypothetical protein